MSGFRQFIVSLLLISAAAFSTAAEREIIQVKGDLYRFKDGGHYSVFLVTPAGVIATDPLNKAAAKWLKKEIQERFQLDIKYVIYSHDHIDHSSGGEVFDDTAMIVAHANTKRAILGEQRPTAVPEITYVDTMTIELGGKQVNLYYVGRNHTDNSSVIHFPAERAIFAVDFISVDTVAHASLLDSYLPEWMDSLAQVEAIDFDILIPGHGNLGNKQHVRNFRNYMNDLYGEVLKYARQEKTLGQIQKLINLEKYQDWENYREHLPLNIEGMYQRIQLHRDGNFL